MTSSLGARVHTFLADYGNGTTWTGVITEEDQRGLFGTAVPEALALSITRQETGRLEVELYRDGRPFTLPLASIQKMAEEEGLDPWDDEPNPFMATDNYRTFASTEAGIAVVANSHTGFRYELFACPNQNVLNLFAMHEGYDSWQEMRRYASPLDLEEFWTVTWSLDPPKDRT